MQNERTSGLGPSPDAGGVRLAGPERSPARTAWLDALRGLAIVCVVLLHTRVATIAHGAVPAGNAAWLLAWLCEPYARLGVPLFTVISGYLLLDPARSDSPMRFWWKRARRILPALLAWHVIYAMLVSGHPIHNPRGPMHLWFLWSIAALYIATPLLRTLVGRTPPGLLFVLSLIGVAATIPTPLRETYTRQTIAAAFLLRSLVLLPFYVLGGSLHGLRSPRGSLVVALALSGVVLRPSLYSPWHAALAAGLVLSLRGREVPALRHAAAIGRNSFGIYLAHRALELWLFHPRWGTGPLAWYVIPVEAVAVLGLSYVACRGYGVVRRNLLLALHGRSPRPAPVASEAPQPDEPAQDVHTPPLA